MALAAIAGIAVLAAVVMALWNCLLPAIFSGVRTVSYWEALGLLALSKILFGSFHGACHGRWREHHARWENLTPEERARLNGRFMSRWSLCCGSDKPDGAADKISKGAE